MLAGLACQTLAPAAPTPTELPPPGLTQSFDSLTPTIPPIIATASAVFGTLTPGAATAEAAGATVTAPPPGGNYQAQSGDMLAALVLRFRTDAATLLLANPTLPLTQSIAPGTWLNVPLAAIPADAFNTRLLPDGEVVYSPAAASFDVRGYVLAQPGYLASYSEVVSATQPAQAGWELVDDYARRYSLNPRLLLALLELQSGALSNPNPDPFLREHGLGVSAPSLAPGLSHQLGWAGNQLLYGFYAWQAGTQLSFSLADGALLQGGAQLNSGSFAVARLLGLLYHRDGFQHATGADGLLAVYRRLFGEIPPDEPLIPGGLAQPEMQLPFEPGRHWGYTGGPHAGYGQTLPWAAIDFAPPAEQPGCVQSLEWEVAVRDGVVTLSDNGLVELDVGGGWVVDYLHVATLERVPAGTVLKRAERIGHPSCEGGRATASHLHISRRYNGVWIAADGFTPFVLSGWTVHSLARLTGGR